MQIRIHGEYRRRCGCGRHRHLLRAGLPAKEELGAGSMTKRIATRRMAGTAASAESSYRGAGGAETPAAAPAGAFAYIEYEDRGVRKTFYMTKNEIVVGRGGRDY